MSNPQNGCHGAREPRARGAGPVPAPARARPAAELPICGRQLLFYFHPVRSHPYSLTDCRGFSRPCGGRPAQTSQGERREERRRIRCHIWRGGGRPGVVPCRLLAERKGDGRFPVGSRSEGSRAGPAPRRPARGQGERAAGRARPGGREQRGRCPTGHPRSRPGPAPRPGRAPPSLGGWEQPPLRLSREVGGVLAQFPRLRTGPQLLAPAPQPAHHVKRKGKSKHTPPAPHISLPSFVFNPLVRSFYPVLRVRYPWPSASLYVDIFM